MTGSVREAVVASGTEFETAWALRQAYPEFAGYWDEAVRMHKEVTVPALAAVMPVDPRRVH